MSDLLQVWYARSASQLVRYSETLSETPTPPTTAWTPAKLVRNKPRIRAADDPGYVDWESYYQAGDTSGGVVDIQAVLDRVPPGPSGHTYRCMSFPEGEFVYADFTNGFYDGVRVGNGGAVNVYALTGAGWDNTIIRPKANSATRDKGTTHATWGLAGQQITISRRPGAFVSNLALRGNPQSFGGKQLGYGGLVFETCPGGWSSVYLRGASPGWGNSPPAETFGINVYKTDDFTDVESEIDGRDDAGNRVCASPIGWNGSGGGSATSGLAVLRDKGANSTFVKNAKVLRSYYHHGIAGMPTIWLTENLYTEDCWSYSCGSGTGGQQGHGWNHEMWRGTITHVRPLLLTHGPQSAGVAPPAPLPNDPVTNNSGFHLNIQTTAPETQLGLVQILEPVWDKAWSGSGMFIISARDDYSGYPDTTHLGPGIVVVKNGVQLIGDTSHPGSGWSNKNPATTFAWID